MQATTRWDRAALGRAGFSGGSDRYERGRPGYPAELIARLVARLPDQRGVAVDLAAGTGKLTRSLCQAGLRTLAVEPSATMRDQCALHVPGARVLGGAAEALPLLDRCAQLITVAQAFHWFDARRALAEAARVLGRGGDLALLWNVRDDRVDWVGELSALLRRAGSSPRVDFDALVPMVDTDGAFEASERWTIPFAPETSHERLVDDVASRSYVHVLPDEERRQFLDGVRSFARQLPDPFAMPYLTEVLVARRR